MSGICPRSGRRWVKANASVDEAHYVVWRDGELLVTLCQQRLPVSETALVRHGARCCRACTSKWRTRRRPGGWNAGMGHHRRG